MLYNFKEEDLLNWPYRDSYLLELLNGTYTLESAREDLKSLIDREYDLQLKGLMDDK